ncbi:MAG: antibiotic biosynthesis monooxygenase [Actinobacteria bacterium]|uniref:Unannotated protein n=1 Tax=freshwater metagenome TaxID=449393 RepID=A0A6J7EMM2_9ZZZZ|nr:antibiotic biosynthesis monooxygenase [Actinomycetota bacterium]
MIREMVFVDVLPEHHDEFEAAVARAVESSLSPSEGFIDFVLARGVERPNTYSMIINWETLEDHTVGFRESERFVTWRELIGPFFAVAPTVDHWTPLG